MDPLADPPAYLHVGGGCATGTPAGTPAGVQPPLDCSHGLLQPFPKPLSAKASGKRKMSELAGAGAEGDLVSYSYGPRVSNPLTDLDPHLRASLDLARRLQAEDGAQLTAADWMTAENDELFNTSPNGFKSDYSIPYDTDYVRAGARLANHGWKRLSSDPRKWEAPTELVMELRHNADAGNGEYQEMDCVEVECEPVD